MSEPSERALLTMALLLVLAIAAMCGSAYVIGQSFADEACRLRTANQAATIATLQRENDSLSTYIALMICVAPGPHPRLRPC